MSFAQPQLLCILGVVPILLLWEWRAHGARRRAWAEFSSGTDPGRLVSKPKSRQLSRFLLATFGMVALIVAAAGPRYGAGGETGVVIGRDLMVVLDLSKSMSVADMADPENKERWQAGKAGIREMVLAARKKGGHRFGLVVFAAKPSLVCPLTSDDEHFLARLEEFSPKAPPTEVRPGPDETISSGTSIGAGIALALYSQDPRFPGFRDILLLSDGDGPGVEAETGPAITMAAEQGVPVHVVGLGDPDHFTELNLGVAQEDFVGTKLREPILQEIAKRTKGEYLPARRDTPALGEWFTNGLETRESRILSDDLIPQPKDRSPWFAGLGLVLLAWAWGRER